MIRKTLLILALPVLAAAGTAIAQNAAAPETGTQPPAPQAAPGQPMPAQFSGARGGRGGHGPMGRGDHGPMGRGGPGGGMMLQLFEEVDSDADGAVTQAEIDAYRAARIGAADADADGALTLAEFQTLWLEQVRPRMVDAFQDLDEDGDGQIAAAELDRRVARVVARLDRDGDGALTQGDRRGRNR